MNWDRPEDRAALIERVGLDEYTRLHAEQMKQATVATVANRAIRIINSRFGRLYAVAGTNKAFGTQAEAEQYARTVPGTPTNPNNNFN